MSKVQKEGNTTGHWLQEDGDVPGDGQVSQEENQGLEKDARLEDVLEDKEEDDLRPLPLTAKTPKALHRLLWDADLRACNFQIDAPTKVLGDLFVTSRTVKVLGDIEEFQPSGLLCTEIKKTRAALTGFRFLVEQPPGHPPRWGKNSFREKAKSNGKAAALLQGKLARVKKPFRADLGRILGQQILLNKELGDVHAVSNIRDHAKILDIEIKEESVEIIGLLRETRSKKKTNTKLRKKSVTFDGNANSKDGNLACSLAGLMVAINRVETAAVIAFMRNQPQITRPIFEAQQREAQDGELVYIIVDAMAAMDTLCGQMVTQLERKKKSLQKKDACSFGEMKFDTLIDGDSTAKRIDSLAMSLQVYRVLLRIARAMLVIDGIDKKELTPKGCLATANVEDLIADLGVRKGVVAQLRSICEIIAPKEDDGGVKDETEVLDESSENSTEDDPFGSFDVLDCFGFHGFYLEDVIKPLLKRLDT
jgi:hypothetical protein